MSTEVDPSAGPGQGQGRALGLVTAGGAAGTLLRHGLELVLGGSGTLPAAMVVANVSGAFVLGLLVARPRQGAGGWSGRSRLLLGTGLLGGYTTYSGLALETVTLLDDAHAARALLLLAGTLVAGVLAGVAGMRLGARSRRGVLS